MTEIHILALQWFAFGIIWGCAITRLLTPWVGTLRIDVRDPENPKQLFEINHKMLMAKRKKWVRIKIDTTADLSNFSQE